MDEAVGADVDHGAQDANEDVEGVLVGEERRLVPALPLARVDELEQRPAVHVLVDHKKGALPDKLGVHIPVGKAGGRGGVGEVVKDAEDVWVRGDALLRVVVVLEVRLDVDRLDLLRVEDHLHRHQQGLPPRRRCRSQDSRAANLHGALVHGAVAPIPAPPVATLPHPDEVRERSQLVRCAENGEQREPAGMGPLRSVAPDGEGNRSPSPRFSVVRPGLALHDLCGCGVGGQRRGVC